MLAARVQGVHHICVRDEPIPPPSANESLICIAAVGICGSETRRNQSDREMLKTKLIHPEILGALGKLGHGSRVLIADGNYPFATGSHPNAQRIYLNLAPGLVSATDVLRVLVDVIPIESAAVMMSESGKKPAIFREFRTLLPKGIEIEEMTRILFYDAARDFSTGLVIATAERRTFANILLTIGVVK